MKSHAIADLASAADPEVLLDRVELLSDLGVDIIQLRAKQLDDRDLLELAVRCRERIGADVHYLLNGRADIAVAAGADGVHLPSDGIPVSIVKRVFPDLVVGVSCHSISEVVAAAAAGADLAVVGPVFAARSSEKAPVVPVSSLLEIDRYGIDVYALGGITVDRLPLLEGTGVAGVAAITMFMADEPAAEIVASVREARI